MTEAKQLIISVEVLDDLLAALRGRGYRVLGPTVRDGAIVYDELGSAGELPIGWTDRQDGGVYRLEQREDEARFGFAVGPHSWKRFLFPPRVRLWRARLDGDAPAVEEEPLDDQPLAFIGVRSCELHAIEIQDRVFLGGKYVGSRLRGATRGRVPRRGQLLRARRRPASARRWAPVPRSSRAPTSR